jgi:hypothetical protein
MNAPGIVQISQMEHYMSQDSPNQKNLYKRDRVDVEKLKHAVEILLGEAQRCSLIDQSMGIPAMITAFAVVMALGESLALENFGESLIGKQKPEDKECIKLFCDDSMSYDWLVNQNEIKQDTVQLLYDVRNSLAHVLSLPDNVVLILTPKHHSYYDKSKIGIVPTLFVDAIKQRSGEIFNKWSTSTIYQSNPSNVERSTITVDTYLGTVPTGGSSKNT